MDKAMTTATETQHATEYRAISVRTFTDANAYYYSVSYDPNSNNAAKADIAKALISKYKRAWDRLAECRVTADLESDRFGILG